MAEQKDRNDKEDITSEEMEKMKETCETSDTEQELDNTGDSNTEASMDAENEDDSVTVEVENEETASDSKNSGMKNVFKKKTDKKQEALNQKVEELEDKVRRQMAEFDNFRKRTDKEKTAMFETGAKSVIEKILPVIDNFERGLATIPEENKGSGFADGMQMIYKQLMTELDNIGVKAIDALGQEFNPDFHNAVMQVESEEYESGVVAQELQKGYMYRDSVVRHSMVGVVN